MTQVEIIDAKDRLAELVNRARLGEEIILSDAGKPVVKLGPAEVKQRIFGEFEGKIQKQDGLWSPLTEDELADWEK